MRKLCSCYQVIFHLKRAVGNIVYGEPNHGSVLYSNRNESLHVNDKTNFFVYILYLFHSFIMRFSWDQSKVNFRSWEKNKHFSNKKALNLTITVCVWKRDFNKFFSYYSTVQIQFVFIYGLQVYWMNTGILLKSIFLLTLRWKLFFWSQYIFVFSLVLKCWVVWIWSMPIQVMR